MPGYGMVRSPMATTCSLVTFLRIDDASMIWSGTCDRSILRDALPTGIWAWCRQVTTGVRGVERAPGPSGDHLVSDQRGLLGAGAAGTCGDLAAPARRCPGHPGAGEASPAGGHPVRSAPAIARVRHADQLVAEPRSGCPRRGQGRPEGNPHASGRRAGSDACRADAHR